ncbi:MAG TPA: NUDIX domain-containing protein [Firmicutes bacterium]|nr:NUDIX domain-containing protein [Bacillota bacterium]
MGISPYYEALRRQIGHSLLLIPGVAAVVRDAEGCILLQQLNDDRWCLPAGAIEPGEKPSEAVAREVFEETGIKVSPESVVAVLGGPQCRVTYPNKDEVEYHIMVFRCRAVGGSLITEGNDETKQAKFFMPSEMPELGFPYPAAIFEEETKGVYFE